MSDHLCHVFHWVVPGLYVVFGWRLYYWCRRVSSVSVRRATILGVMAAVFFFCSLAGYMADNLGFMQFWATVAHIPIILLMLFLIIGGAPKDLAQFIEDKDHG